jgi:hypothetical protein
MASSQNGKLTKWQVGKRQVITAASKQNSKLLKWLADKAAS